MEKINKVVTEFVVFGWGREAFGGFEGGSLIIIVMMNWSLWEIIGFFSVVRGIQRHFGGSIIKIFVFQKNLKINFIISKY